MGISTSYINQNTSHIIIFIQIAYHHWNYTVETNNKINKKMDFEKLMSINVSKFLVKRETIERLIKYLESVLEYRKINNINT